MTNIFSYNDQMKKSLLDKIFFIDKVIADIFIDYGCADGSMIKFLGEMFPDSTFVGYDISQEMIDIAMSDNKLKNVSFTSDFNEILNMSRGNEVALILSSVLHEIYHFNKDSQLWLNDVKNLNPKFVIIRDMTISRTAKRSADEISVAKVWMNHNQQQLKEWEEKWGSLNSNWSLLHFLLKYRFQDNWSTEFNENYLSYNLEKLFEDIPDNYEPIFVEHYILPFVRNEVKKTFNIDIQDKTHLKLILKRA